MDAGTTTRQPGGRRRPRDARREARPVAVAADSAAAAGARPLRIMVLDPDGGSAGHSHDLCNALSERGSDVHLFTSPAWGRAVGRCRTRQYRPRIEFGGAGARRIEDAGSAVARSFWAVVRVLGYLWSLLRILPATRRYDVVHVQSAPMPVPDAVWLWLVGRRTTVARTVRGPPEAGEEREWWRRAARRAAYRAADLLFVHSDSHARRLRGQFGVAPERIVRIRHGNAAHLADLKERAPSCAIGHGGVPVILFVGPLRPEGGVDVLLKAANHLRRAVWDFRIVVAGPVGPAEPDCEDLVRDLGLERMVEFRLGRLGEDELPAYLRQAAVLVFPHRREPRTETLVSACTFGKPVVASRIGALVELVEEADNGILVRPDDPRSLADALAEILRDDDLRRRYETNSLIYARTDLSWRRIGGDVAVAYRSAVERSPAPAAAVGRRA